MTNNQLRQLAEDNGLVLEYVTKWSPPEGDDLRPLIAMPNIPRPLHAVAPRTILGASTWNRIRKACYAKADDTCEICGYKPDILRRRHAHEVYEIDYVKGEARFVRAFCVCSLDHLGCIHTGRAITLYGEDNPLYPRDFLLDGAEKAFKTIYEYNKETGSDLKLYRTFIEYLKYDELRAPMLDLIKKYNVKFYSEDPKKTAKWGEWKLYIGNQAHPTPYKDEKEWREAMKKMSGSDSARIMHKKAEEKFSGEIYNELNNILKEVEEEKDKDKE